MVEIICPIKILRADVGSSTNVTAPRKIQESEMVGMFSDGGWLTANN